MVNRITQETASPRAFFELAIEYRRRGILAEAVEMMRRSVSLNPEPITPKLNIGFFLYEARRYREALDEFVTLQQEYPDEAQVRYGLALCHHRMGSYGKAVALWREFLRMAPHSPYRARVQEFLREAEEHLDPSGDQRK
jgi:Tfp pilus assembly protein PilF